MELKKPAIAGTLESSDAQVLIEPADQGVQVTLNSTVKKQYGDQILETVQEVLDKLDIKDAHVVINDQGALDCTIRSRVQTAVLRSAEVSQNLPWGTKL